MPPTPIPPTSRTDTPAAVPTESDLALLSVAVCTEDLEWVHAMMRASGCPSYSVLGNAAFYHFGRHLEIGMPTSAFRLPKSTGRVR